MTTKQPEHDIRVPYVVSSGSDLLPDLLTRLPLKSLVRFRLVCKRWQSIITCNPMVKHWQSIFACDHMIFRRLLNTTPAGLLILSTTPSFRKERCNILRSCNGLFLCSKLFGASSRYYDCNPTTMKFVRVPEPDGKHHTWCNVVGMCLAFDPADSPNYKVVAITMYYSRFQIYIYSSETGRWKLSSGYYYDQVNGVQGVYWNDAIHWISASRSLSAKCFNVKNGSLLSMPNLPMTKPSTIREWKNGYYCGESRGHLYFVESGFTELDSYEMKRDYSEWFLKHTVNIYDTTMGEYDHRKVTILSVVCGEHDDVSFLLLRVPGKIIRYNLASNTCEKLHDIEDNSCQIRAFHYIESLCPV